MKQSKLGNYVKMVSKFVDENKPVIMAGMALAGTVITGISAFKAGIKAGPIIEKKKKEMELVDQNDKNAKKAVIKEEIKELVPVVAPPIIMALGTCGSIVGSHKASAKKLAVISAAYDLSKTKALELNNKMNEMLGDKKVKQIKDAVVKDNFKKMENENNNIIISTDGGSVPCIDMYTGRPFESTYEKIGQAINKVSHDIASEMYISLNEFYDAIGSIGRIPAGDDFGWNVDDLQADGCLPITMSSMISQNGKPCICLNYDISPRFDYRKLH